MANIETKVKAPTQKEMYERIKTAMEYDAEVVEFCEKKLTQLASKSSKVDTKKIAEQEIIMDAIRDVLVECTDNLGMQCGAIYKDERVSAVASSSQKVNAILIRMIATGDVIKTTEKKTSFFKLAQRNKGGTNRPYT